jgi:hypothetical protein
MLGLFDARARRGTVAALLLLGLLCQLLAAPARADDEWETRATTYFTIYYTTGQAATAERYAAVVDDLYAYVAAGFDHGPATPVPLRLYPNSRAYASANPIAGVVEGVVAHADPRRGEIGVAVDRVARTNPETLRDTVRHELMHLALIELTADHLPIGFQEGVAQYAEKEATDRRRLVQGLERAQGRMLSWDELNEQRRFVGRMTVSYPEALSVVAFLVDRYGLGTFKRFLQELQPGGQTYREALAAAYGRSADELEAEWREYLPAYFQERWEVNLLRALDLADARTRFAAGEYEAARPLFEEAQRLHTDLGQTTRAAEAEGYLARTERAIAASDLATQGRARLADRDYVAAHDLLVEADRSYAEAGDERWRPLLAGALSEAERGSEAAAELAAAQQLVAGWRYPEGRARSSAAAALYLGIGDTSGLAQAEGLHAAAEEGQRRLAVILLVAGGLILAGLGVRMGRGRRAQPEPRPVTTESITL